MAASTKSYERMRRSLRHRFAQNIRAERRRLGLTQERAAERVGFSLQYYQRIEREIVNVPLDTIARFANV
jgi:transcriptional regulator with XRE-family HTH domain